MKVYINCYKNHWISPSTIVDYMFFWTAWSKCSRNKLFVPNEEWIDSPKWADKLADYLEPISHAIKWVWDKVDHKIDYVKIDHWDTWSADHTLSYIILPLLKQLKEQKHGYPLTEDKDVPKALRSTAKGARDGCDEYDWDNNAEKRWDYILDEMIFAFEHIVDDAWQDEFSSGEHDIVWVEDPSNPHLRQMTEGPNHTYKWDQAGEKKVQDRIDNGLKLFGKYYRALWT